jgi:hypothetical protein
VRRAPRRPTAVPRPARGIVRARCWRQPRTHPEPTPRPGSRAGHTARTHAATPDSPPAAHAHRGQAVVPTTYSSGYPSRRCIAHPSAHLPIRSPVCSLACAWLSVVGRRWNLRAELHLSIASLAFWAIHHLPTASLKPTELLIAEHCPPARRSRSSLRPPSTASPSTTTGRSSAPTNSRNRTPGDHSCLLHPFPVDPSLPLVGIELP